MNYVVVLKGDAMLMKKITFKTITDDLSEVIVQLAYTRENMLHESRDRNEFNAGVIGGQIEALIEIRTNVHKLQDKLIDII